jgi:hypothetical protein
VTEEFQSIKLRPNILTQKVPLLLLTGNSLFLQRAFVSDETAFLFSSPHWYTLKKHKNGLASLLPMAGQ